MDDLHALPKFRDSLSSLYVEHARIDRHEQSIAVHDATGYVPVPAASLAVLMLGPGTNITQSAVAALAENNCLTIWCGEENVRFYASGTGGTRSAAPILLQARLASNETTRLEVVQRMYRMRLGEEFDPTLSVEQLRGLEGVRVRQGYALLSRETGVPWHGRIYDRSDWSAADPVNRAISCANACLYGLCHAAVLATGFSPAIGFVHTGKQLSFVYDIADLYKMEITVPLAFQIALERPGDLERSVRLRCRDIFKTSRLLQRIVPDIRAALGTISGDVAEEFGPDADPGLPTDLWSPEEEG